MKCSLSFSIDMPLYQPCNNVGQFWSKMAK